jgi:hypothetical protein
MHAEDSALFADLYFTFARGKILSAVAQEGMCVNISVLIP